MHILITALFTLVAFGAALVAGGAVYFLHSRDIVTAGLAGIVVLLVGLVFRFYLTARAAEARNLRHVILIKRAYDRNRTDLVSARNEIRQLFEVLEEEGGEQVANFLDKVSEAEDMQVQARPPPQAQAQPPAPAPGESGRTEPVASAGEVAALRRLADKLYADRGGAGSVIRKRLQGDRDDGDAQRNPAAPRTGPKSVSATAPQPADGATDGAADKAAADRARAREKTLRLLHQALKDNRIDLGLVPIIRLSGREPAFHECISMIDSGEGTPLIPGAYADIAEDEGLLSAIDNMLPFRAMQLLRRVRRSRSDGVFFCAIPPHTLSDDGFFADFCAFMRENKGLADSMILALRRDVFLQRRNAVQIDLEGLGECGYRFCLDGVDRADVAPGEWEGLPFTCLKFDAPRLARRMAEAEGEATTLAIRRPQWRAAGLDLIAGKVESDAMLDGLAGFGFQFGHGPLFGPAVDSRDFLDRLQPDAPAPPPQDRDDREG